MNSKFRFLAITGAHVHEIPLRGLTPVGGKSGSGISIKELKHAADYLIAAPHDKGISIHPLRSLKAGAIHLSPGQALQIEDLTVLVDLESKQTLESPRGQDSIRLQKALQEMSFGKSTVQPLQTLLHTIMELCSHEKGVVISQSLKGSFEVLASINIESSQSWLSESIVQQALHSKEPVIIQNILGSGFDTKKSIIATNFLSIFCWPLVVQGNTVGALITASQRPYGGSFEEVKVQSETYAHLAALLLEFHIRELHLKMQLEDVHNHAEESPFLTQDPALQKVCDLARKVSDSDLSVLIQGETGVGKEVLARWIHQQSSRKQGPFVAINCAAIPSELLESILFGHKRGSFSGAHSDHVGKIQLANGGTLFLDEIGDMPLNLQAKLLRVLQERTVEPIGSSKSIPVDIRLICATHKPLKKMAADRSFRDDLYYRLAQVTLAISPLRERVTDIRILAQKFLKEMAPEKRLTQDGWSWLLSQSWQGNVRELKSAIERACVLSQGKEISSEHFLFGSDLSTSSTHSHSWLGAPDLESAKHHFVNQKIHQALELTKGNRTRAAEILGVTPRTLFRYLEGMTDRS